jgi:hypothetical protein
MRRNFGLAGLPECRICAASVATTQEIQQPRTVEPAQRTITAARSPLVDRLRRERLLLAFVAGALIARIVFWVTTNRMFEDGLTTITHARNVPLGLGLTHHPGEGPIHGFTSALGVLIPLVGELIHEGSGMLAMRLASLAAACVAIGYARFLCRDLRIGTFPTAFLLAYLAFDQNMIFFGMSGMETQVAVAVLLAGVYHVRRIEFVAAGICLGLAPLVRPEFVLWLAPAFVYLMRKNLRGTLVTGGIAAGFVAPWVAFTTVYYGSPIPNTIVAKSTIYPIPPFFTDGSITAWFQWLTSQIAGHLALLVYHLEPFREVWSTAKVPIPQPVLIAIAIVSAYFFVLGVFAIRDHRDMWPALTFVALFFAYRIYFIPTLNYYDWYWPPFMAVFTLFVALGMQRMATPIVNSPRYLALAPKTAAAVLGIAFAIHMPFSFVVESHVQSIEGQIRTNVGLYLRAHVAPGQSVLSESAGYIGFYSNVDLHDYPGLTSKISVHALQSLPPDHRGIADLIAAIRPDWLVLRPWELVSLEFEYPDVASLYGVQKVFEVPNIPDKLLSTQGAYGVEFAGYAEYDPDMKFTVLKRTG